MTPGNLFLGLFLALLSLQLGMSMALPEVTWVGIGLCLLGAPRIVPVERPTWGLLFVLFVSGGFVGSQVLEDWAVDASWVQNNGTGAGFILSLLVYLLWLYAAREKKGTDVFSESSSPGTSAIAANNAAKNKSVPFILSSGAGTVLNRDVQTILVLGLLLMLLMTPPDRSVLMIAAVPVPIITVAAVLLASLTLLADRCAGMLLSRLMLLLPLLLLVPMTVVMLRMGQGPVINALVNLFPNSSSNFTPTGFSPRQQLRASMFLRPSTRAVLRIEAESLPSPYLAGNRLVHLDEDLQWLPSELPLRTVNAISADPLPGGEWRFPIDNHHASSEILAGQLDVRGLTSDNYLFVSPGTSHIIGRFGAMTRNAADVWSPAYERGADKRWQLETGGQSVPEVRSDENLQLPDFWDASLQNRSEEFLGENAQHTVDKLLSHYTTSLYSLQTSFDAEQPFHDFYLNDRPAYCFWYATAATLALRANGIPSRLIGGYVVHERLSDNLWLVRERDAHSWVEWQDANGYWHTIDPTPPSINAFFGGYQSPRLSVWYHMLASNWQQLIDRILADEATASAVRWGGLAILLFLFVREYRRIREKQAQLEDRLQRWQKLWQRFLREAKLPAQASWTATMYADNLPTEWPAAWAEAVRTFLQNYNLSRFSTDDESALRNVEGELSRCLSVLTEK